MTQHGVMLGGGVIDANAPTQVASVKALCVHDSDLIVGGYFVGPAGGSLMVNNICGYDGMNWFAMGASADVYAVYSWDGVLYIGGPFGSINGDFIRKWVNNQWSTVGDNILLGVTNSFAVYDSILYAGGGGMKLMEI